jgi:putative CocE/NonD family hydrolase
MSVSSWILARAYGLPPRLFAARTVRDIRITTPDGIELATDLFRPRPEGRYPTLMMRLPYGRRGFDTVGEVFAERGYNVVLQACRGTGGSTGDFDPLARERDDGLVTIAWIVQQPWYDGRLGTTGPSYLGYAQWAICDAPEISAMSVKVSSAEFKSVVFPAGAFHLQLWLSWLQTVEGINSGSERFFGRMVSGGIERRTFEAGLTLPLVEADVAVTGRQVPFWRRWFEIAVDSDEFWGPLDHTGRLNAKTPPNHFVSGWYDFMIDQLLRDYRLLVDAGQTPYLTVGPWFHVSTELQAESLRQTLSWMKAHLHGDRSDLRERPVRLFVTGDNRWHEFDAYPPRGAGSLELHLHPSSALMPIPSPQARPDRYLYDPNDPTPNQGGGIFAFVGAGSVDNRQREGRADLRLFTSDCLKVSVTIIGRVRLRLFARASRPHVDFFVRLCDVDPDGRSMNICDGLVRASPGSPPPLANGVLSFDIELNATAHTFRPGHRLRLQVSSGAHPRYARNSGTDEPIGTATTLKSNTIEIFHDPSHPSALTLPVYELD